MIKVLMHESVSLGATGSILGHESLSVEIEYLMIDTIRSDERRKPPKLQLIPLVLCETDKVTSSQRYFVIAKHS
jgi:hypothetical protein